MFWRNAKEENAFLFCVTVQTDIYVCVFIWYGQICLCDAFMHQMLFRGSQAGLQPQTDGISLMINWNGRQHYWVWDILMPYLSEFELKLWWLHFAYPFLLSILQNHVHVEITYLGASMTFAPQHVLKKNMSSWHIQVLSLPPSMFSGRICLLDISKCYQTKVCRTNYSLFFWVRLLPLLSNMGFLFVWASEFSEKAKSNRWDLHFPLKVRVACCITYG